MKRNFRDWIEAYLEFTSNTEPCEMYRRWCAISCIAAVLQRKVWIRWEKKYYPNMYVVLVSPPGAGRKGTAMGPIKPFLREIGIPMTANSVTGAQLIKSIKKAKSAVKLANEAVVTEHHSITVFSEEFTVFLGYNQLDLMTYLIDWFDTPEGDWIRETATQGQFAIENIWVNILGGTTTDFMRTAMSAESAGGGLLSRIIFIYANKRGKIVSVPHLMKVDGKWVQAPDIYAQDDPIRLKLTNDLRIIHSLSGEFTITPEFLEVYIPWYSNLDSERQKFTGPLASFSERRQVHLLKLCIVVSASRSSDKIITDTDFHTAREYLAEAEAVMPKVFRGFGEADNAYIIQSIMTTIALKGSIHFGELLGRHLSDVGSQEDLIKILRTLMSIKPPFCSFDQKTSIITYLPEGDQQ